MIETIIRNYLKTSLDKPVFIEVPADPPVSYVSIERTGGREVEHIRSSIIAIQSYGGSSFEAATLHETVLALMKNIITLDSVSACDLNAEYDYTDRQTKRYRYQAVFDITYY